MKSEELIKKFYTAFTNGDVNGMVDCYHDDVVFEDPAFGVLKGEKAKDMWRMLLSRSDGKTKITFSVDEANENTGHASWEALYNYGPKKRKVLNKIAAKFEFKDGKIIKHTDTFNLWKWTQQAMGASGYLLGWSGFMKTKIQEQTNGMLQKFRTEKGS